MDCTGSVRIDYAGVEKTFSTSFQTIVISSEGNIKVFRNYGVDHLLIRTTV